MIDIIFLILCIPTFRLIWWFWAYKHQTLNYLTYRSYMPPEDFEVLVKHWLYVAAGVAWVCVFIYKLS